jgi:hypothetical protein
MPPARCKSSSPIVVLAVIVPSVVVLIRSRSLFVFGQAPARRSAPTSQCIAPLPRWLAQAAARQAGDCNERRAVPSGLQWQNQVSDHGVHGRSLPSPPSQPVGRLDDKVGDAQQMAELDARPGWLT